MKKVIGRLPAAQSSDNYNFPCKAPMQKRNKHILLKLLQFKPLTQKELETAMQAAQEEDEFVEQACLLTIQQLKDEGE